MDAEAKRYCLAGDTVPLDTHRISPYLHSVFGEFLGTMVYDGIWVGRESAIPNTEGLRNDVIAGCREAGVRAFRWPGGCCADHYHWKNGVGPERPPRLHPMPDIDRLWRHEFGTDEYMRFCELIGAEPILVANTATGTPEEFLDWFEYCNGPAESRYGAARAANGHPEPYDVRIWGLGNTDENVWHASYEDPGFYARRFLQWRTAIREDSRQLKLIGLGLSRRRNGGFEGWVPGFLDAVTGGGRQKGPDSLSIHRYVGAAWDMDPACGRACEFTDQGYYATLELTDLYRRDIDEHRQYIARHGCPDHPTTISFDEWGLWHPEAAESPRSNQPQTWRDGMFAACLLHLFYRNSDIVEYAMATQLCNVLQSLYETDGPKFHKTPTHYVFKLYKEHLGQRLLPLCAEPANGMLDAVVSVADDASRIVLTLVNKDLAEPVVVDLGPAVAGWKVVAADRIAPAGVRCRNTFDAPEQVTDEPFDVDCLREVDVAPHSVARLVLRGPS